MPCLQCFDTVGWASGKASGLYVKKTECWGAGTVICLERGADLHMVQLMPLHPQNSSSVASFKSRLVLPFWYRLKLVVLEKRQLNSSSVVVIADARMTLPASKTAAQPVKTLHKTTLPHPVFRTDYMDSPDCLLLLLSISDFLAF